jgi:hypothetical protein
MQIACLPITDVVRSIRRVRLPQPRIKTVHITLTSHGKSFRRVFMGHKCERYGVETAKRLPPMYPSRKSTAGPTSVGPT